MKSIIINIVISLISIIIFGLSISFVRNNPIIKLYNSNGTYDEGYETEIDFPTSGTYFFMIDGLATYYGYTVNPMNKSLNVSFTVPEEFTINVDLELALTNASIPFAETSGLSATEIGGYDVIATVPVHDMTYEMTILPFVNNGNLRYLDFAFVHQHYRLARMGIFVGGFVAIIASIASLRSIKKYRSEQLLYRLKLRREKERPMSNDYLTDDPDDVFAEYYRNKK